MRQPWLAYDSSLSFYNPVQRGKFLISGHQPPATV